MVPWLGRCRLVCGCLTLLMMTACNRGGQTGDGSEVFDPPLPRDPAPNVVTDGDQATGGLGCESETEVVEDLDEDVGLGFTAQDILDMAEGPFESSMQWGESPWLEFGPESGEGEVTLRVSHEGGEVRLLRPIEPEPNSDADSATDAATDADATDEALDFEEGCMPALEVDVVVHLTSSGGALDETFEATLVARAADWATFYRELDPNRLDGRFEVTGIEPEDAELVQFAVNGALSPYGTSGHIGAVIESQSGDGDEGVTSGAWADIARWPVAGECVTDEGLSESAIVVEPDVSFGDFSVNDTLELLQGLSPIDLQWQDGRATQLSLDVERSGAPCMQRDDYGHTTLSYPVQLGVETSDDVWKREFDGVAIAWRGQKGTLDSVGLRVTIDSIAPDELAEVSGLSGVDASGYDAATLNFSLEYEPAHETLFGWLELSGAKQAECVERAPEPEGPDGQSSSPGCEGTQIDSIESAVIGEEK